DPKKLAAEPALRHVRSLKLTFSYEGVGLLDLLRSPHLAQLERLSVVGDGPSSEFIEGLAGLDTLSLVALELSPRGHDVELSRQALEALAFSPRMGRLVELRLDSCRLAQSASVLWRAGALPSLKSLGLTRAGSEADHLTGFGDGPGLPLLEALDLAHNDLD